MNYWDVSQKNSKLAPFFKHHMDSSRRFAPQKFTAEFPVTKPRDTSQPRLSKAAMQKHQDQLHSPPRLMEHQAGNLKIMAVKKKIHKFQWGVFKGKNILTSTKGCVNSVLLRGSVRKKSYPFSKRTERMVLH